MGRKKNKSNGFLTVLLIILIVVLIGALLFTLNMFGIEIPFFNVDENAFEKALNENNYQAAYTIFSSEESGEEELSLLNDHVSEYFLLCEMDDYSSETWTKFRGLEVFKTEIEKTVIDKMEEVVVEYYNSSIDEDKAKLILSRLSKFSFTEDKYNECIEQVALKDYSDKAYLEGVELYNSGDIEGAVKAFRKVSEKDGQRYPLALNAIETCKVQWGSVKLAEAQRMIDAYNKEGATDLLETLIDVFGQYEEAENMLSTLTPEGEG